MTELQKNFKDIEPYVPGEQPQYADKIKLNTNENPYPPSPAVKRVLESFDVDDLKLYPDPNASELVQAIADYYSVDRDMVFTGVGSDDVLAMCFLSFFNSGKPILFPDITYSFYPVWANLFDIKYETKPLNEDFEIVKDDYLVENGGVVFPNPNAPTGVELSLDTIEEIIQYNQDRIVIVDEAYVDFGAKTALPLVKKYKNLVVVQTFSKSRSLAGLRIGFAIADKELISVLNAVKNSYNSYTMNSLTLKAGSATIKDDKYFKETTAKIIATREKTKAELSKLNFEFKDSKSNFIFAKHKKVKAVDIFNALREKHIFVRYFNQPRIDNYLRITIGTEDEMRALIDFLKDYLSEK